MRVIERAIRLFCGLGVERPRRRWRVMLRGWQPTLERQAEEFVVVIQQGDSTATRIAYGKAI